MSHSETEFKESSVFEEFAHYFSDLPPTLLAKLRTRFEHAMTEAIAETSERGRIVDLENDVDAIDLAGSNDEEADHYVKAMKMLFKNGHLSISSELFTKILTFPQTLFRKPAKVIYNPSKTYQNIKAYLAHLEDNGDFEEFDSYSNDLVEKYSKKGDFDIVAVVKIEQAQCALYRNNLVAARRLAREAHDLAGRTQFPPLFHAQAYLMMSNVYRYKQKLGETKRYLDLAEQCFESGYSTDDLAHFHEVNGSYLDRFLGTFSKPDKRVRDLALTSFQKMGEVGSQDSSPRVSNKKRFYAMIKSARIHLDSNSSFGRKQRTVTKDSIHLAAECLRVIKRDLLDSIPHGSKIQFQLVESDLYYRQGKFEDAIELLKKSFAEAIEFGYDQKSQR